MGSSSNYSNVDLGLSGDSKDGINGSMVGDTPIDPLEEEDKEQERKIIQLHYEGWPDFGVPETTNQFRIILSYMNRLSDVKLHENDNKKNGPVLTHCSAGLGRTGTLIAAHIAAQSLELGLAKTSDEIDLKKLVLQLREQRQGMVQTKEQYKFLHQVVKEISEKGLPPLGPEVEL